MLDFDTDLLDAHLDQSWNSLNSLEPGTPEVNASFMERKQVNHHGIHGIFWCVCTVEILGWAVGKQWFFDVFRFPTFET